MQVLAQTTETITLPEVDWRAIAPELALAGAGVVLLMVVAFAPGTRRGLLAALTLLGLAAAAALTAWNWELERSAFDGAVALDGVTRYARVILLAVGALTALMAAHDGRRDPDSPPETFPLLLFGLLGMVLLAAAADLLVVFIALEILSLSLYVMAGATRRLAPQEAAMKYFLLGAFSSAFLLYGLALAYGATGTTSLLGISRALADPSIPMPLVLGAAALLAVGFFFKVAAVPFHMWTPDVYQGAPVSVTAFMAAGTKAAGFAVFLRVFAGALGGLAPSWRPVIAGVAAVTMLLGALLAVVQQDVKRLLAYSSIAHAGYLLIGVAAATSVAAALPASLFYLLTYAFMVMGAFMVVQYASRVGGEERALLEDYRGFGRQHPLPAALMALFLLSLAGVPLTSGFWAKYFLFQAGVDAGLTWLVLVGVLSSVIAAYFYLRVIVVTFLQEPAAGTEPAPVSSSPSLALALGLAALVTVALSVAPQALLTAAETAERMLG